MCGICGIIIKKKQAFRPVDKIVQMNNAIKHRGPDGEGYLMVSENKCLPLSGKTPIQNTNKLPTYFPSENVLAHAENTNIDLFLAHRRLSIIDLSMGGHQPLCDAAQQCWITYNGELYNYPELKIELLQRGYLFHSESDTEVILAAYLEWGFNCVKKFNGMWAFCIYDRRKKLCFMSRDRLGVKPLYYIANDNCFAFASEQKAFVKAGFIQASASKKAVSDYLLQELIENDTENFFEGISELWPGHNMIYDLQSHTFQTREYYRINKELLPDNNAFSDAELIDKIESLLENAIRLRLRSDVEVGTCLSGGIDSSVIAGLMAAGATNKIHCFTAIFKNNAISEEHFANVVTAKIPSVHKKIEPSLDGFLQEVDTLIYSQDAPIWNTSTYAQYKVMALAKESGIKVVLDGQGADELFGGYHHHFLAKWNHLFSHGKWIEGIKDISSAHKTIPHPFLFFTKEKIKQKHSFKNNLQSQLLNQDFVEAGTPKHKPDLRDVNHALLDDIYATRLKTFLKCEDRCGMWHSVESRTPFSDDVDLINFMFSFKGERKIQHGISKHLLREAGKKYLPKEIYSRYDKVGFETPMQSWVKSIRQQIIDEIRSANFAFVNTAGIESSDPNNVYQNKLLFKLFVLSKWQRIFAQA